MLRAEVLAVRGHLDQARSLLDRALAKQPEQVELWVALANLISRSQKPEEALTILDDAEKRLGDKVELRQARAGYWTRKGGAEALAALAKLESDVGKFNADDLTSLQRELATDYLRLGKDRDAERIWKVLALSQPDDLNVRLTLFDRAMKGGSAKAATDALDQIRRIEGEDGSLWRYGRAVLLIDRYRMSSKDRSLLTQARSDLRRRWPLSGPPGRVCRWRGPRST